MTQLAGPVYLISAAGELDLSTAPPFRAKVFNAIARGGRRLILDLSGVTFIDSTCIGVLLDAHRRAHQLDGDLVLVCTDSNVLKVFGLAGLDRLMQIHHSVESAAAQYGTEQADSDSELLTEALTRRAEGPSPPAEALEARIARNQALFREVNERVEEVHGDLGEHGTIEFLCECGDPGCLEAVALSLEEYEAIRKHADRFVVAEGHKTAGVERVVARHGASEVVEKTGRARRIAEELDPRPPES